MKRAILLAAGIILAAIAAFYLLADDAGERWSFQNITEQEEYALLFVGDIMLDRGVDYANRTQGTGEPEYPFALIAETLREADLTIGNLEGPISDKGVNVGSQYSFRMDPKYIEGLKFAGFDVLSLANNHMFDYGGVALMDTVERLNNAGIETAGAGRDFWQANAAATKELTDGTKIAFLSYTNLYPANLQAGETNPGVSSIYLDSTSPAEPLEFGIKDHIISLRDKVDIIVLLWHWGEEYETRSNAREQQIAHELIDAGADIIVGHHPHVPQEIETYNGKYIAYSLGNFIFDQFFSKETMRGLMLEVKIKDKKIISAQPIHIQLTPTYQPYIVESQ